MTPFLDGFYYGYMATKDPKWVAMLVDWTDSWVKRGVKEPDGYLGWPKPGAAGTDVDKLNGYNADSLLGEAMVLRAVVLMSGEIRKTPALKEKYGVKAESYLQLAEQVYEKWDRRGAWRETKDGGMISVVLPFGIDAATGKWTAGYETRNAAGNGFSHPNNKANHVARWLLALSDVTAKPVYKERAEKWFRLMKSRMQVNAGGTYSDLELLAAGRPLGSPARRRAEALGRRTPQRRLLRYRRDRHRGRLRPRSGVHPGGHQPPRGHRPYRKAVLARPRAAQRRNPAEIRGKSRPG